MELDVKEIKSTYRYQFIESDTRFWATSQLRERERERLSRDGEWQKERSSKSLAMVVLLVAMRVRELGCKRDREEERVWGLFWFRPRDWSHRCWWRWVVVNRVRSGAETTMEGCKVLWVRERERDKVREKWKEEIRIMFLSIFIKNDFYYNAHYHLLSIKFKRN